MLEGPHTICPHTQRKSCIRSSSWPLLVAKPSGIAKLLAGNPGCVLHWCAAADQRGCSLRSLRFPRRHSPGWAGASTTPHGTWWWNSGWVRALVVRVVFGHTVILTLRDLPRPGPAHPREHGDSATPKSLDPKQKGLGLGGSRFMVWGLGVLGFRVQGSRFRF